MLLITLIIVFGAVLILSLKTDTSIIKLSREHLVLILIIVHGWCGNLSTMGLATKMLSKLPQLV